MKNSIILGCGIVVSILFLIFSTSIFEALYYEREFSNEMYNQRLYSTVAILTAVIAWGFAALYYYVIDSVRFSRWYHWGVVMVATALVAATVTDLYADNVFAEAGLNFTNKLFGFCVMDGILGAVLFSIASFAMRWWSKNCRHTPIPE